MLMILKAYVALQEKFRRDERGVTAMEYGLIAALIAVVLLTVLGTIGQNLTTKFQAIADKLV